MGARERRKGHDWEREVARRFREALRVDARRGQQSRDGADAADVIGIPLFYPECKHRVKVSPEVALRQAQANCKDPTLWPIAIIKRTRSAPYVVIDLEDFLELAAAHWHETKPEPFP